MDGTVYDRDLWTRVQAEALRRLAARRENLASELDLPNVIEEIESLGNEQVSKVGSHLAPMLEHPVYLATLPQDNAVRSWRLPAPCPFTIDELLDDDAELDPLLDRLAPPQE